MSTPEITALIALLVLTVLFILTIVANNIQYKKEQDQTKHEVEAMKSLRNSKPKAP